MSENDTCFFTNFPARCGASGIAEGRFYESDACGQYHISLTLDQMRKQDGGNSLGPRQAKFNCARKCLELQREGMTAFWTTRKDLESTRIAISSRNHLIACAVEDYIEMPIDHAQKPHWLLESFGRKLETRGAFSQFAIQPSDLAWARIAGNHEELGTIVRYLMEEKLIYMKFTGPNPTPAQIGHAAGGANLQMTVEGWQKLNDRDAGLNSNKAFIATAFRWPEEDALRNEAIEAIKRACTKNGYDAHIVSQSHTGSITDRILSEIRNSRFVVAEFTFNNRGVYFEAGFARGLGKPVFHLVREGFDSHDDNLDKEGKKIHFDIQQMMYRKWNSVEDLESKLADWIGASVGRFRQA